MLRGALRRISRDGGESLRAAPRRAFAAPRAGQGVDMEPLTYEQTMTDSRAAFLAAVSAVQPARLVGSAVQLAGNVLKVKGREFHLKQPCHVVGFGKAVLEMAIATERVLGNLMEVALVSVPAGTLEKHPVPSSSRIEVLEGATNNLPDKQAEENARRILELVASLKEDDTLLVLISGGGSALLPLPLPPLTLEDKLQVIKELANAGADILQLNCVRKRLSSVKGGHLAAAAYPATVISLILSDVIGDPIDFIASGPTSPNSDALQAAWNIICKFNLQKSIPKTAQASLTSKDATPIEFNHSKVHNILIGNNSVAVNAAVEEMRLLNYSVSVLSLNIEGNVAEVARFYAMLAAYICEMMTSGSSGIQLESLATGQTLPTNTQENIEKAVKSSCKKKGVCLIAGGETTVKVTGRGIGGRNQELALRFAEESKALGQANLHMSDYKVSLLSAGTDGIDGPTNAAGAFGYAEQLDAGENHTNYLSENDSHTFYSKLQNGRNLIVTGHTGTNVMDIHILCIQKRSPNK